MSKNEDKKFNFWSKKDIIYPLLLYIIFFFIHILYSIKVDYPLLSPDEHSYIGNVRQLLHGYGFCPYIHYYNLGYSLSIIPAFLFSDKIEIVFKSIQVLNAGFASFIPVLIYILISKFKQNVTARQKFVIAFVISLYPAFIVYPSLALCEALFVPLYLLLALLVYYSVKHNSKLLYAITPFLGVYLWLIHPRGLGVLVSLLIILTVFCLKNRKFSNFGILTVFLIAALSIKFFIDKTMDSYLISSLSQSLENTDYYSISSMIHFYSIPSNVINLYKFILGHLLYASLSTYGIFLLGTFYLIKSIKNKIIKNENFYLESFCLLSFIITFIGSAVYMNYYNFTVDNYFYGRYQESVIIPILIMGMIYFVKKQITLKTILITNFSILIFAFGLYLSCLRPIEGLPLLEIMITGMYFYKWITPNFGFIYLVLFYLLLMNLIFCISIRHKKGALIFMASVFIFHSVFLHFDLLQLNSKIVKKSTSLVTPLEDLMNKDKSSTINYDKAGADARMFYNYKLFLPKINYVLFNSSKREKPISKIIISSNPKLNKIYKNIKFVKKETNREEYLWVKN